MRYLLVKKSLYFFDGHGTPELGGHTLSVVKADEKSKLMGLEEGKIYTNDLETGQYVEIEGIDFLERSPQNSYSEKCVITKVKDLSELDAWIITEHIKHYKSMLDEIP